MWWPVSTCRSALHLDPAENILFVPLCLLCAVLPWLMARLAFALHYAFLRYENAAGGLRFPEDDAPDLLDFALMVGTTFAVSEMEVVRKATRRLVLKHTLVLVCLQHGDSRAHPAVCCRQLEDRRG
ncbi:DUF1345 domain-containing protein [Deinococcus hopiensis]|uniref:DUF1345 domain-containing protein n=1 Tax=Deinococcus hopiensis TaxID=309885 RepID=UPI000A06E5D6|nr:DUF1345 domain-containing protein [Deinococcus hopiensis]